MGGEREGRQRKREKAVLGFRPAREGLKKAQGWGPEGRLILIAGAWAGGLFA